MVELKLGPLPKLGMVRMTVALPAPLKEELECYAAEYGRLYGRVEASALVPHMIEAFLRSDRGWRRRKAQATREHRRDAPVAEDELSRQEEPPPR